MSRYPAVALCVLLAVSGCGYEARLPTTTPPPTPPAPPAQAGLTLSLSSSPINAAVASSGGGPWSAQWTLTVRETSGIAGTIDSVRATLVSTTGALLAETELGADQVGAQLGGSNRVRGGSSQGLAMGLDFDFPADAPTANLVVTVQLKDDRGNTVSASVEDVVQICVPSLLTPEEGARIDNGCTNRENGISWEFDWSECPSAERYHLYVRQRTEPELLVDRPDLITSSFTDLQNRVIPEESRYDWTWKVRAQINGIWGEWSAERKFEVEPANTDCVTP